MSPAGENPRTAAGVARTTVVFGLDLSYPWVVPIHAGFCAAPEATGWRVLLATYRGKPLLDLEVTLGAAGAGPVAWAVAEIGLALACRRAGRACVMLGLAPKPDGRRAIPSVWTDYRAVGARAAEEFLERGYPALGMVGLWPGATPVACLKAEGFRATALAGGARLVEPPEWAESDGWPGEQVIERLVRWMAELPAPVGLAAVNVEAACELVWAAQRAGRRVPEEVGLMAAGEDPVLLGQVEPPLSGVVEDGFEIGRRAARAVAEQLAGREPRWEHESVGPRGVQRRASTGHFAHPDPVLARALDHIWRRTGGCCTLEEVAAAAHVSRATLLRKFVAVRGHPPSEEIRRAKLARAVELIRDTHLPLAEVSEMAGFGLQSALSRAVRAATGKTPSEWRRRPGGGG